MAHRPQGGQGRIRAPEAPPTQQPGPPGCGQVLTEEDGLPPPPAPLRQCPLTCSPLSEGSKEGDFLLWCQRSSDYSRVQPPWTCPLLLTRSGCPGFSGHVRPWLGPCLLVGKPQPHSVPCHPRGGQKPLSICQSHLAGLAPGPRARPTSLLLMAATWQVMGLCAAWPHL